MKKLEYNSEQEEHLEHPAQKIIDKLKTIPGIECREEDALMTKLWIDESVLNSIQDDLGELEKKLNGYESFGVNKNEKDPFYGYCLLFFGATNTAQGF